MKSTNRWFLERLFHVKINVLALQIDEIIEKLSLTKCVLKKKLNFDFSYAATDNINESLDN
jgi:hypothetical protein